VTGKAKETAMAKVTVILITRLPAKETVILMSGLGPRVTPRAKATQTHLAAV
jgi:nucleoside phosphorylase